MQPVCNRNYFALTYYPASANLRTETRPVWTSVHRGLRDVHVVHDLSRVFIDLGYAWGGSITNLPRQVRERTSPERLREKRPNLDARDLVVLPTRPPLNDEEPPLLKRRIERGHDSIEVEIFDALRHVIAACDRSRLLLARHISLPEEARAYQEVYFHVSKGARVCGMRPLDGRQQRPKDPQRTVAYLVSIPSVPPRGYRLLAAFGFGGTETLVFGHLLGTHWSSLVRDVVQCERVRIVIFSFRVPDWAPCPLVDYRPEEVGAQIVADLQFDSPLGRKRRRGGRA